MEVLRPTALAEALEARAAHPDALPIAGGTDVMVELNFDKARPPVILDLTAVPELATVDRDDGAVRIGAGVPYTRVIDDLSDVLSALAQASRTVGSPQIRNRGTIGGNLGTASPAGDAHPPLLAADATAEVASTRGTRTIATSDFFLGPGRSALEPDELVVARSPSRRRATASSSRRSARATRWSSPSARSPSGSTPSAAASAPGSAPPARRRCAPPRPRSSSQALLDEHDAWHADQPIGEAARKRFGELVAQAARPIDDHRGSAAYRRHALGVLAARTLGWACG